MNFKNTDVTSVARAQLVSLRSEMQKVAASYPDKMSKYHLEDLIFRIGKALDPKS
jgi:hypothetical protein